MIRGREHARDKQPPWSVVLLLRRKGCWTDNAPRESETLRLTAVRTWLARDRPEPKEAKQAPEWAIFKRSHAHCSLVRDWLNFVGFRHSTLVASSSRLQYCPAMMRPMSRYWSLTRRFLFS